MRQPRPALIAGRARSRTVQWTVRRRNHPLSEQPPVTAFAGRHRNRAWQRRTTGRSGFDRGRGRSLFRLIVGNQRIGVGHVDAAFIAADVVDDRIVAGELGQMRGLGTEVGQGRGVAEADFDVFFHAEAALFALTEKSSAWVSIQRTGEANCQEQFGQEQTAELLVVIGVGIPHGRVVERGLDTLGRHDFRGSWRRISLWSSRNGVATRFRM